MNPTNASSSLSQAELEQLKEPPPMKKVNPRREKIMFRYIFLAILGLSTYCFSHETTMLAKGSILNFVDKVENTEDSLNRLKHYCDMLESNPEKLTYYMPMIRQEIEDLTNLI